MAYKLAATWRQPTLIQVTQVNSGAGLVSEMVINVCTHRNANAAVHRW